MNYRCAQPPDAGDAATLASPRPLLSIILGLYEPGDNAGVRWHTSYTSTQAAAPAIPHAQCEH